MQAQGKRASGRKRRPDAKAEPAAERKPQKAEPQTRPKGPPERELSIVDDVVVPVAKGALVVVGVTVGLAVLGLWELGKFVHKKKKEEEARQRREEERARARFYGCCHGAGRQHAEDEELRERVDDLEAEVERLRDEVEELRFEEYLLHDSSDDEEDAYDYDDDD
eukprot:tig00020816_g14111.t1